MQAAFVDIGLSKDAFLYAGDYTTNLGDFAGAMLAGEEDEDADPDTDVDVEELAPRRDATPIEELLHKGQNVLVQVSKESLGTKGARITSFVSLPGRYLVYMPQARHIGVSRRTAASATSASATGCGRCCAASPCRRADSSSERTPRARARASSPPTWNS